MINQKLLVSGADFFTDDFEINPYYNKDKINIKKACAEHAEILKCFEQASIELVRVAAPEGCQDGVYTANWALVKDGVAIMSRLPEARKGEEPYAKAQLQALGYKCLEVPYVDNLKHGKEIYYNPDGRITKIVEYEKGKMISEDNNPQNLSE